MNDNNQPNQPPGALPQQQPRPYHTTTARNVANELFTHGYLYNDPRPPAKYLTVTFPIMVQHNRLMGPFIISIGEDFDTFIAYVQEFFQLHNPPSVAVEFGGAERHWGSPVLTADNIKPMLRLLRVREGVDMLHVWPAVDAAMDDTSDVM